MSQAACRSKTCEIWGSACLPGQFAWRAPWAAIVGEIALYIMNS